MTAGSDALPRPGARPWWRWRHARRRARGAAARAAAGVRARFGGGEDREGDLVTVYTARTPEEAWIVRGLLVANDVPAIVERTSGGSVWGVGILRVGVPVLVPGAMAERAEAVLRARGEEGDER